MKIIQKEQPDLIQELAGKALLKGDKVTSYTKYLKEYASAYKNSALAQQNGDTLAYHVLAFCDENTKKDATSLSWGVTYMEPIDVDGECCLTKGHFHQDTSCPEYYMGISGEGMLIKWDGKDEVIIEKMFPNSLHWIDGKYAHRVVNTSDTQLAFSACYLTNGGHNYQAIEDSGFPVRIYKRNGKIEVVEQ